MKVWMSATCVLVAMLRLRLERGTKGEVVMSKVTKKRRKKIQLTTKQMVNERMYEDALSLDADRHPEDYIR